MSGLGNKEIFSRNLRTYMEKHGKDRNTVCDDLGFKYTTFNDWYNGKKYPRIDKIEMLANYFGVMKSDLIEDKPTEQPSTPTFDDFTFAMQNETRDLTDLDKQLLLSMAKQLNDARKVRDGDPE